MTATPILNIGSVISMLGTLTVELNSGTIKIYSGSAPASMKVSATGTLLSSGCTYGATAFGAAVDGGSTGIATATANAIASDTNAAASGSAGYFRACNSGGTEIVQGVCGTSSADMILNTVSIVAGSTVAVTAHTISMPDGSGVD